MSLFCDFLFRLGSNNWQIVFKIRPSALDCKTRRGSLSPAGSWVMLRKLHTSDVLVWRSKWHKHWNITSFAFWHDLWLNILTESYNSIITKCRVIFSQKNPYHWHKISEPELSLLFHQGQNHKKVLKQNKKIEERWISLQILVHSLTKARLSGQKRSFSPEPSSTRCTNRLRHLSIQASIFARYA